MLYSFIFAFSYGLNYILFVYFLNID
jgi:hypothetical protein